jgi:hypothetical protein
MCEAAIRQERLRATPSILKCWSTAESRSLPTVDEKNPTDRNSCHQSRFLISGTRWRISRLPPLLRPKVFQWALEDPAAVLRNPDQVVRVAGGAMGTPSDLHAPIIPENWADNWPAPPAQPSTGGFHPWSDCKAPLVWVPKYRKPVLVGPVALRVRDLVRQRAMEHELDIVEGKVARDHVHLPIAYRPHRSISMIARWLKGSAPGCSCRRPSEPTAF